MQLDDVFPNGLGRVRVVKLDASFECSILRGARRALGGAYLRVIGTEIASKWASQLCCRPLWLSHILRHIGAPTLDSRGPNERIQYGPWNVESCLWGDRSENTYFARPARPVSPSTSAGICAASSSSRRSPTTASAWSTSRYGAAAGGLGNRTWPWLS